VEGAGINVVGNVISADVDGTTVKILADKIAIGDIAGSGLSGGNGDKVSLAFTTDTHPFVVENGGLKLRVDGQTLDFDTANNNTLYVKVIDCGTF